MFTDGSLGVRCIWWLLQCSHLLVPLCIAVCPVGAHLTAACGAALCPVALLCAFLPIWCPPGNRKSAVQDLWCTGWRERWKGGGGGGGGQGCSRCNTPPQTWLREPCRSSKPLCPLGVRPQWTSTAGHDHSAPLMDSPLTWRSVPPLHTLPIVSCWRRTADGCPTACTSGDSAANAVKPIGKGWRSGWGAAGGSHKTAATAAGVGRILVVPTWW